MQVESKYFGTIQADPKTVFTFVTPIFGFEEYRKYTIFIDSEVGNDFLWLQSIESSDLCFILVNPFAFKTFETYSFSDEQLLSVNVNHSNQVDVFCILNAKDTLQDSMVNLRSPIIFNPLNNLAAQIIVDQDLPIRERLVDF